MKVNLSFEKSNSLDVAIMVDALRASTTITVALDKFKEVIPTLTPEDATNIAKNKRVILAGERTGKKLDGFELGNSPLEIINYKGEDETLVLTTTNGTRVMENMKAKHILVGGYINAKSVAKVAIEIATEEIEIVMGGFNGTFAIEDYIAAGEILYWIEKEINKNEIPNNPQKGMSDEEYQNLEETISEYGKSAILASQNKDHAKNAFLNSNSAKRLTYLGYEDDVIFCCNKNISENVAIYKNKSLKLYKHRY